MLRAARGGVPSGSVAAGRSAAREGPLHDPAHLAQARAVLGGAPSDDWLDSAGPQLTAVLVVVIAAIGDHALGSLARTTDPATHWPDPVHEGQQLGDVVTVTARQADRQRDARGIDDQMVL